MTGNEDDGRGSKNEIISQYHLSEEASRIIRHELAIHLRSLAVITRDDLEAAKDEARRVVLKELGFPEKTLDEAIADFRRNQDWVKDQRELRIQLRKHGITVVLVALLGIIGTGLVLWLKSVTKS